MGVIAEGIPRGCQGLFTPVSLGYPLSVFNKKLYSKPNPDPHPPKGCPSNSLGLVWANMYSDPLSTTTPAAVGIDSPDCVKWRETLPSQEESAGRDIPMGQLVTKVLMSRESPLPPCQLWPGHNSPIHSHLRLEINEKI